MCGDGFWSASRLSCPFCISVVLEGRRATPPEDVGGVSGYHELLEVLADPEHEEHQPFRTWAGHRFDPERFDLAAVNRRLARLPRTSRTALRIVTRRYAD